jgi:L-malate glycosyltransferase
VNILYLINHAGQGGTEKYIQILIKNFSPKNKIFFIYNEYGPLCAEIKKHNILMHKINMSNPFDISAAFKIAVFCNKNKIDIVHTQFQREAYICALSKLFYNKFKLVYTCHINLYNPFYRKIANFIISKNYDAITTVSSIGKDILVQNKFTENKIEVIFNGIEYVDCKNELVSSSIRNELEIPNDVFIFSTLTRFSEEKGNEFLIKSIEKLKDTTSKKFVVLFAGDGVLLQEMKLYVEKNNLGKYVFFLGYRNDTLEILSSTDVFLNSSSNEALSFALLEAMSKSLPLIVTSVGGNKDLVNDSTNCGLCVDYGDIDGFADAMKELMTNENLRTTCSNNSLLAIKNDFNLDTTLKKTYDLYERLVK